MLIPASGMLIYAEPVFSFSREVGRGDQALVVKEKDRSYAEKVMRCVARDDRCVIADVVYGASFGSKRRMFLLTEYKFFPVGPEVAKALGLEEQPE